VPIAIRPAGQAPRDHRCGRPPAGRV